MSLPKTMKAMVLTGHGGPGKLEYREDWPVPDVEPDEVLVKVGACGVNNTDIWVREGAYGTSDDPDAVASFGDSPLQFPMIQGADIAGFIVAVGSKGDPARVGERVMVDFGIYGGEGNDIPSYDYIGSGRQGGFAEFVSIPAENAHAVTTELSDAELATFCCAEEVSQRGHRNSPVRCRRPRARGALRERSRCDTSSAQAGRNAARLTHLWRKSHANGQCGNG